MARRIPLTLLSLTLLAVACSSGGTGGGPSVDPAESDPPDRPIPVTLELDWTPNPDHAGFYYAEEHGMFADESLDVTMHAPSNPADPIKFVGLGRVDLAISYEPDVFIALDNDLPVTAVATVIPVPLNSLLVAPDADVTSVEDLRGGTVGVTGIPTTDAFYDTILDEAGLDPGEVEKVNVGFNLLTTVLSGKADAVLGAFRNVEGVQLEQETGEPATVFPVDELGVPPYAELVLVANSDRLADDPTYADLVGRFVRAFVRGLDGAIADPEGATEIIKDVTQYEPDFLDGSVPATLELSVAPGSEPTGCMDTATWQSFGDWMTGRDLIGGADAGAAVTTDFLPSDCPA